MLCRAVDSVLLQTYENVEVIIVDDNSSDSQFRKETEKILEKYSNELRVRYIRHQENKGGGAARNTGILAAKGEYVGFLDDDDVWLDSFIEEHLSIFNEDPDSGVVYCKYFVQFDKYNSDKCPVNSDDFSGMLFDKLLQGWCPTTTSLFLIKKECFTEACMFDESLKGFQDYDLWLRMSQKYKFNFSDKLLVIKCEHSFEQLAMNPIKRQNALDTLESKWKCLLSSLEMSHIQKTVKDFQKKIFYRFLNMRHFKKR